MVILVLLHFPTTQFCKYIKIIGTVYHTVVITIPENHSVIGLSLPYRMSM